jgi:hypothetical protein
MNKSRLAADLSVRTPDLTAGRRSRCAAKPGHLLLLTVALSLVAQSATIALYADAKARENAEARLTLYHEEKTYRQSVP